MFGAARVLAGGAESVSVISEGRHAFLENLPQGAQTNFRHGTRYSPSDRPSARAPRISHSPDPFIAATSTTPTKVSLTRPEITDSRELGATELTKRISDLLSCGTKSILHQVCTFAKLTDFDTARVVELLVSGQEECVIIDELKKIPNLADYMIYFLIFTYIS